MHTPVRFLTHSLIAPITAAVLLALLTPLKADHHELIIQGGSIIDTRTGKAMDNQTVVIEGDRITRVAPAKEVAVPSDARVVDARGRWIVPGLIEMHVHRGGQPDLVPFALYVANGVTSIRDMGGNLTLLRLARKEVESWKRLGPRLFFLGPLLDGDPPMAPPIAVIVDTPARAISTVNFLVDQGVDAIKIYNGISAPILEVISAHRATSKRSSRGSCTAGSHCLACGRDRHARSRAFDHPRCGSGSVGCADARGARQD
jgi:hypothetical protein